MSKYKQLACCMQLIKCYVLLSSVSSLIEISVLNKEECYMKSETTSELLTTIRMNINVAGLEVDARLFAPSLPSPESVVVTSHTGKIIFILHGVMGRSFEVEL